MSQNQKTESCCVVSCEKPLDQNYWNSQYQSGTTNWDLGEVSPPLKSYFDQLTNKSISILIPGCGNAHEADYLLKLGFTNVTLIDIAPAVVEKLQLQYAGNPNIKIVLGDFFTHDEKYDLVVEQTFFCALPPSMRNQYAEKMNSILTENGKLVGLLFNRQFEHQGPPFGGSKCSYESLFNPLFTLKTFEPAYNSFIKRQDTELFMQLTKK
jgi:SAM-dependent methyltransferase